MANEWRGWVRLPNGNYAAAYPTASGIPAHGGIVLQGTNPEADAYWHLRESWRNQTTEEVEALYAKWLPKRDAVLAKEEHLGKSRADWERFYLALADELAGRQYASGKVSLDFGLDGKALLKAMQLGGRAG